MRSRFYLVVAVCLLAVIAPASTRRHKPALQGSIDGQTTPVRQPVEPIIGQVLPPSAAGGSLVSHGNYLYALMGDRVYKLDPRDLKVLSVQRLGAPLTGGAPVTRLKAKARTKRKVRRVIEE